MKLSDLVTAPPVADAGVAYAACRFEYDNAAPVHRVSAFGHETILPQSLERAAPKRQAEFLAGRHCAGLALAQIGGPICNIPIGADRSAQWPRGFVGSITHNDTHAVAIVGPKARFAGLGVDREMIMDAHSAQKLHPSFLNPTEISLRPQIQSFAAFASLVFSAKEALYKATYPLIGHFFGFHDVALLRVSSSQFWFAMVGSSLPSWRIRVDYLLRVDYCETLLVLPAGWPKSGGANAPD